ncbi:hypothetical protein RvY_07956 [Ramazzottius varieornatus]|uniref:Uncharacterized protein n=1 Tax=Ramazzottius varieornatus TaxID=947166 RepID=A0A1D1V6V6_RAMVA|nr:hypothetical protein RvY_07956 [Ramazzottius varieornatus]
MEGLPVNATVTTHVDSTVTVVEAPSKTAKKKALSSSQMNIRGVFLHVAGDALGSVVVIIAAAIIWKTDWRYRHYIDPAMSLISVVVILSMTIPLVYSSSLILLQSVPVHMNATAIGQGLAKIDGVLSIRNFHIWQLDGRVTICSAHLKFHSYSKYRQVAKQIKDYLRSEGIDRVTIEPEFEDEASHAAVVLETSVRMSSKSDNPRGIIPLRVQSLPALDGHLEGQTG